MRAFYFAALANTTWVSLVAFHMPFATLFASCLCEQSVLSVSMGLVDGNVPSLLLELGPRTCFENANWVEFIALLRWATDEPESLCSRKHEVSL
jgi:hypothetical protein